MAIKKESRSEVFLIISNTANKFVFVPRVLELACKFEFVVRMDQRSLTNGSGSQTFT